MKASYLIFALTIIVLFNNVGISQNHKKRYDAIDVQDYHFTLQLNDSSNSIVGSAEIKVNFKQSVQQLQLDLIKDLNGTGMIVSNVMENGNALAYRHESNKLLIELPMAQAGTTRTIIVNYSGVPADGLIISRNKYGDRTFFGDNWPDRGQHYLPIVDHPSDKATVTWTIVAPNHYQVIANGVLNKMVDVSGKLRLTEWVMKTPIPTKVMVMGAAAFAVKNYNHTGTPVSAWVYPQDELKGFSDYILAERTLSFFTAKIGPYPFQKLANVQSKTRFGGMENAGNIFYSENSVNGTGDAEALIAHEVAHQWFGNSASEANWHHIWLSEGFATAMTNFYLEEQYGTDTLKSRFKQQRNEIISFHSLNPVPVIDTTVTEYMDLLTTNAYQKGGWILYMLREKLGDVLFWECIQNYYEKFKYSNALTSDFQGICENVSNTDLSEFFDQWLYIAGHPVLNVTHQASKKELKVTVEQMQDLPFSFPLDILIKDDSGEHNHKLKIDTRKATFSFLITGKLNSFTLDPDTRLLFEVVEN